MKRKLLAIALCLAMSLPVGVYAEDAEADKTARIEEIKAQIAELKAELKELEGDAEAEEDPVVYQDDKVIITYTGITEDYSGYDLNFVIENLTTDNKLTVQMREASINGYMANPLFSAEIAPGKKSKTDAAILGDDAETTPMDEVEDIETKFLIFVDSLSNYYETDTIIIE